MRSGTELSQFLRVFLPALFDAIFSSFILFLSSLTATNIRNLNIVFVIAF